MAESGEIRKITITMDLATGDIIAPIIDNAGNSATKLTPEQFEDRYKRGMKYCGTIFHSKLSPGCVIITVGGTPYLICY